MASNSRPIQFRDYLPEVFRADEVNGVSFFTDFLQAFETLFEELQAMIEGTPLRLTVQTISGTTITVAPFTTGLLEIPIDTPVTAPAKGLSTRLSEPIPAQGSTQNHIQVREASFVAGLSPADLIEVRPVGGIPELFSPETTPPPEFLHRPPPGPDNPDPDFEYLAYLASWIALPLRVEKPISFNRTFFETAAPLVRQRSTLPGMDALLRAWLKGDLLETAPPLLILTDLTRAYTDVNAVFRLGETATLGVDTVLGEGPPFFFIADLITDETVRELRHPVGLDIFQRAARFLLDAEKPAYTYYQLRVRAHTMQLAPPTPAPFTFPYAQIGVTTLLWDEPWVFDSDC